MKVGIIGLGEMGGSILKGLIKKGGYTIQATTSSATTAQAASKKFGVPCHTDNERLVRESDLVLVCVKPRFVQNLLKGLADEFTDKKLLVSIAAGPTLEQLESWSGKKAPVVRAMPNTPSFVNEGMTVLCTGHSAKEHHAKTALALFETIGHAAFIDESQMDAAVGVSGCGPAYLYLVIEAMADGGVKMGLGRDLALKLAAQTCLGAARMVLETGRHPGQLKDSVTTPGGCTIEAVAALENGKLRSTLIRAVTAAAEKSKALR